MGGASEPQEDAGTGLGGTQLLTLPSPPHAHLSLPPPPHSSHPLCFLPGLVDKAG